MVGPSSAGKAAALGRKGERLQRHRREAGCGVGSCCNSAVVLTTVVVAGPGESVFASGRWLLHSTKAPTVPMVAVATTISPGAPSARAVRPTIQSATTKPMAMRSEVGMLFTGSPRVVRHALAGVPTICVRELRSSPVPVRCNLTVFSRLQMKVLKTRQLHLKLAVVSSEVFLIFLVPAGSVTLA